MLLSPACEVFRNACSSRLTIMLSSHSARTVFIAALLSVSTLGCYERVVGPNANAPRPGPPPPSAQISIDDGCWSDMVVGCSDDQTHDNGLIDGQSYQFLGGTAPCYTSAAGSCGGGFGGWDDGSGCIVSQTQPSCISVGGGLSSSWRGCPAEVSFNSTNVTTGASELWVLRRAGTYNKLGWMMGSYTGSYSSQGFSTPNATGQMVCAAGFIAFTAHG